MQIRQLQIANDSVQDRLLLRVGTQANEEFRIWLTRRFLKELWPHLVDMLLGHFALDEAPPSEPAAGETTVFDQSFIDDNPTFPLGAKPLLASEAVLDASSERGASLSLREGRERRFALPLTGEVLQALCAMLRAANDEAGWDLELEYGPAPLDIAPPGSNALLH